MNDSGIQSTYIRLLPHLRLTRIYPSELSLRLGIQGRNIDFFIREFCQNLRVEINNKNGDLASRGLGSKAATTRSRDIGTGPGVDPQKLAVLVSTNLSGLRTPGPVTDGTRASGLRGNCDCFAGSGGKTRSLTIITQHARPGLSKPREDPVCVQLCAEKVVRPRGSPHTCV